MNPGQSIPWLLVAIVFINATVFLVFGYDKRQARLDGWRVPERTLLILSLSGPFGAFAGMRTFRHKTQKTIFVVLVPVFVVLQIAAAAFIMTVTG